MRQLRRTASIMLDVSPILRREKPLNIRMLVSDSDQFQLRGDDLAADAGDDGVEAGESFADVVGEFDVADDALDVLCSEAVDEGGFGEERVGGGLAGTQVSYTVGIHKRYSA